MEPKISSGTDGSNAATKASWRKTFREHRLLLSLPIVLAVVIAAFFALGSPKSYQSSASIWVDNPASADSSLGNVNPAVLPPAQQEQSVLEELVATQSFVLTVARESGLDKYLASHGSGGFSLTSLLGGGGSVEEKVIGSFGPKQVLTTVPGPQVLQISYRGPTPGLSRSTLDALVNELQRESDKLSQQRNQGVLAFDRAQVTAASNALATARAALNTYLRQHPGATGTDPSLSALQTAAGAASSQLTQASQKLNEAQSTVNDTGSSGSTIAVIDRPSLPLGPVSGKKKELLIVVGGLVAGLLISFLGAIALTPAEKDTWDENVAGAVRPPPTVDAPPTSNGNGRPGVPRPDVEPAIGRASRGGLVIARSGRFVDESAHDAS